MIFQATLDLVLAGLKTETSRIAKPGERLVEINGKRTILTASGRIKYQVGQVRAAQPGRTQKGVARIRITELRDKYPVRNCSLETAGREVGIEAGLYAYYKFMEIWNSVHGMGKHTFSRGPEVWGIVFEVIHE